MSNSNANSLYADAHAFIEQGLCHDEVGERTNARQMYERGLSSADQALRLDTAQNGTLRQGLLHVRNMVEQRIAAISANANSQIEKQKVDEIRCNLGDAGRVLEGAADAELFYWLPDGVQLVMIENDQTNAPSPPTSLAIFKLSEEETATYLSQNAREKSLPAAFIQVGPWAYPLVPGRTSILKSELGVYVMPNPTRDKPNMFVGIILPRELGPQLEEEFNFALSQFAELRQSHVVEQMSAEQRERTSERIAAFLVRTGTYLAQNAQAAAQRTGKYIEDRAAQYRCGMEPTGEPVNINPAIRHGVFVLHKGSKVVAKVTRFLLDKIGDVGIAVGQRVADSVSGESGGGRAFQGAATVLGGGIAAVSTVWMSLEDASRTLMRSIANETCQTVQLRYGDEASEMTHHALYAIGHTTMAGFQLTEFGPRSIAGRMARKAGLQLVRDVGVASNGQPNGASKEVSSKKKN